MAVRRVDARDAAGEADTAAVAGVEEAAGRPNSGSWGHSRWAADDCSCSGDRADADRPAGALREDPAAEEGGGRSR